ncbi:ATP-binding response regulator [Paludibacterium paludis]|uniref:Response regulatory domain-containing protein n=1 Tax=Paludibacterium paludis TaxID=1225769 RepID=A0A918P657_9NEIS|nr:response regulator [Paludibacterium paludis]GGY29795.1 hypothetical protein GCM10011289_35880 [Paludibacterium paludis]
MGHRLLLVDDEPFNLELMAELLEDAGFESVQAETGEEAWAILEKDGANFATVLLDKMMPGMDGFEVLKRIKSTPSLEFLPVIMQTAVGAAASVQEGLSAGAFYYLTKPFSREMLLAVVEAAVSHWDRHAYFKELATQQIEALRNLNEACFALRTHKEAQQVTTLLAKTCPSPEKAATGLFELLVNAIEHGNLALSFQEKTALQADGQWEHELERRLGSAEYGSRQVTVRFARDPESIRFVIEDEGSGFDWEHYLSAPGSSLIETHGRGILIARRLSFDRLEYRGKGNVVEAQVSLR